MVEKRLFNSMLDQDVTLYILRSEELEVELLPYGATVRAIRVHDREGHWVDVCLGYESLITYQKEGGCLGGTLGRCANRIGGARFVIGDTEYTLDANNGPNSIHGGTTGFHRRLWKTAKVLENSVVFDYFSRNGEEGFPGNLNVRVIYTLEGTTLRMEYAALPDQDTVVNMTNHTYFNLGGQKSGPVLDHVIRVRADAYTPTDDTNCPTGQIAGVEGTALDLRQPRVVGEVLKDPMLERTKGLDHNLILSPCNEDKCAPAAELYCPRTGIALEVRSTQEGMQVYSAGWLDARTGKDGAVYGPAHAICFESQHFPNAINCPGFPSPVLKAGEVFRAETSWKFFTK